jgi:hypothetical protein
MKKTNSTSDTDAITWQAIKVRLDALVLLSLRSNFSDENGKLKYSEAAPILHIAGYSPTEIATLFGKKKATEISMFLYPKKKNKE